MPGKIKVKVLAGRNLPVMDRASDTTDAFVEIKFGSVTHKTDVCRKSLNPQWSSTEWYRFEVDEAELQDEPLQLRLMDHDTYSANDAIGKVVISLAPLLAREANNTKGAGAPRGGAVMSGWIPVFDTMHGIRGELNVIVKVELFSDFNKYKTSSCGVQFFHCPMIPPGYRVSAIHGFVEELVVNDDPEYQWIDKIRTPRASNEARQVAFIKLSNQVQRLVGVKAAELGANAVVGYQQDFDLEGEAGVVARAIGTAVSVIPLPIPCQPISIPTCSQQQLKKYLDILATDTESITDLNQYFQNHQDELQKLLNVLNPKTPALLDEPENVDDDDKSMDLTRQSSVKSYVGNVSIYQDDYVSQNSLKHLSEDQTDLNKLLKGNEDSDSDSTSPLQKIKKIKTNFFTKRFGNFRSRNTDKQDDQISIQSNSSDTSRISLTDIKNEFKKLKRLKKPKFRKVFVNKQDEGIGMASILARSVIHAHTSLACIAETQDSEYSPNSTMRRTSESEPTINMSEEDTIRVVNIENVESKTIQNDTIKKVPEKHTSLENFNTNENTGLIRHRKLSESCPTTPMACRSENLLKLPGETGYFGSLSLSGDSSEMYSSSEEDDESSDQKTDTEKSIETTSFVVQTVLNRGVDPVLIIPKDRKLSVLEAISDPNEIKYQTNIGHKPEQASYFSRCSERTTRNDFEINKNNNVGVYIDSKTSHVATSLEKKTDVLAESDDHNNHFKFHNLFAHKKPSRSISAPSSPVEQTGFVYRSSKRIRRQLSKISKSNMIKSLSHYSLRPKKKHTETKLALSQPGSSSDVPSKVPSRETVLGSPFLSYADLLSIDKENTHVHKPLQKSEELGHSKVTMYIGSEPVSRASLSGSSYHKEDANIYDQISHKKERSLKSTGLVHTAVETILIDKVQSLLVPTSPEANQSKEKLFFDHVNKKLEKVEEDRNINETKIYEQCLQRENIRDAPKAKHKQGSLIHTAIETILIDKVQSLLIPTTPDPVQSPEQELVFGGFHDKFETIDEINTNNYEIKIDDTDKIEPNLKKDEDNLVSTAMKTMLMEKVHSLMPIDSKTVNLEDNRSFTDVSKQNKSIDNRDKNSDSLFRCAMKTILMDKAQNLLPSTIETLLPMEKQNVDMNDTADKCPDNSPNKTQNSLIHTAIETMLMDKFQSLLIPTSPVSELKVRHSKSEGQLNILEPLSSNVKRSNRMIRQDSIHSISEPDDESRKMSKEIDSNIVIPCKVTQNKPFLQHFHPILSGAPLETIPSLPESSFDHTESLDIEGLERSCDSHSECDSDTNSASVCDNSHAACRFDRTERSERDRESSDKDSESPRHARHESYGGREPVTLALQHNLSLNSSTPVGMHRRSSDSDLSVTPKGSSLNASLGNAGSGGGAILRPSMNSNNLDMLEYPFLTMAEYPPGFIVHFGGTVCARSVKLVDAGGESAARAAWWAELRTELRAHARALRCNAVLAYSETAAICEDVCVLSACGTAAVINVDCYFNTDLDSPATSGSKIALEDLENETCTLAHVPYSPGTGPYRAELSNCGGCRKSRVPAVLLATCAKPNRLISYARAVTLTAVATRVRRAPPASEPGARDISDQLPFLEYELHKLLLSKLRMQGANALFSLQTHIAIGERCVMALASGTAVRLAALPPPTPPRIKVVGNADSDKDALDLQKALWDAFTANKAANGYDVVSGQSDQPTNTAIVVEPEVEEPPPVLDLCADKDACVLELDEAEDVETARALTVRRLQMQVYNTSLSAIPAVPPQAFAQVWRARLVLASQGGAASTTAERHLTRALEGVIYKLRRLQPCSLVTPRFQLELPEDEIQIVVSGTAIQLQDPSMIEDLSVDEPDLSQSNGISESSGNTTNISLGSGTGDADDDIFALDEEQLPKSPLSEIIEDKHILLNGQVPTTVSLTSLSFVNGSRAARRICALRLLFVRETTAVRELGGLSGFLHTFTCEVFAIVRAYTAALGGNALTSFYVTQLMLQDNAHKNQGQCLLSVGGDVVHITY